MCSSDLWKPPKPAGSRPPTLFYLFGRLGADAHFDVTEEHRLETLWRLQDDDHQPEQLLRELQHGHLLLIGTRLPDWIAWLYGHTGVLYGAVFSPDGTRIVTVSDDRTAKVWDVHAETRSAHEIAALVRCFIPWRLEQGALVPTTPDPSRCR